MPAGRPLKFKTVKELQKKIDEYFEITPKDEWTITGLAMALDTSRKVLCEYEDERPEFSNAIKRAKLKVENGYEIDLKKAGRSGTIFALKNFDWKDKTETEHSGEVSVKQIYAGKSLSGHNSDTEDIFSNKENTSSSGRDISEQDN